MKNLKKNSLMSALIFFVLFATQNATAQNTSTTDEGVVINGVTWATRNIDAPGIFAETPESAGMFYQWNRKVGWSSINPLINSNGDADWLYSFYSYEWSAKWQEVNSPSPVGWRVPALDELEKLTETEKVTYEWTEQNGVNGGKFTDKATGKSIFIPAVGYRFNTNLFYVGSDGDYWSSDYWAGQDDYYAKSLDFDNERVSLYGGNKCVSALPVRCVKAGTSAVSEVFDERAKVIDCYSVTGKRLSKEPESGFYILKYDNGKSEKKLKTRK